MSEVGFLVAVEMISRSQAAFRLSFARLAGTGRRLYFWTFTAAKPLEDRQFAEAFNWFMTKVRYRLKKQGKEWAALRVFEPHFGEGPRNGKAHAHFACNFRWHISEFRACADGTGIGRVMWVQRVRDADYLGGYLSKYCSKSFGMLGCRRWAAMSSRAEKGWHCKRGAVVADWPEAEEMRALYREFQGQPGAAVLVSQRMAIRNGIRAGLSTTEEVENDPVGFAAKCALNARVQRLGGVSRWRVADDPLSVEFRALLLENEEACSSN